MRKLSIRLATLIDRPRAIAAVLLAACAGVFLLGEAAIRSGEQRALALMGPEAPVSAAPADPVPATGTEPEAAPAATGGAHYGPPAPELVVTAGRIADDESLGMQLAERGIDPGVIDLVARELRGVFDFRYSRPGDQYRLIQRADGGIAEFAYTTTKDRTYRLYREAEDFVAETQGDGLVRREARIAGVISTSLYEAVKELGESTRLASEFSRIFAWDVDFSRSTQPGDEFHIVYERLYRPLPGGGEEYVKPGRVLAAQYRGAAGNHTALFFETDPERGGYYKPDGSAVHRQFLAAPLRYSRISSRYTNRRRHPVLGVVRAHRGIDYAAPRGTPVWAVGEGTVVHVGWHGGMGKTVKVRHNNGYVSYYGHLSRYASGLRRGAKVSQKQVIGHVGATGLATGPHLHFAVEKNGRLVNPALVQTPAAPPVPEPLQPQFAEVRDALLQQLSPPSLLPETDEAL